MSNEVINPYQQFRDDTNGNVLENGTLTFNVNESSTLSTIYSDEALTIAQSNPYTLDAAGRVTGDVKFTGRKRMIVKDQNGATIRTIDNVVSADIGVNSQRILIKTTVGTMKADASIVAGDIVQTLEHKTGYGYRGGSLYLAQAVTGASDDNGSIIKSTGNTAIEFLNLFPEGPNVCHWEASGAGLTVDNTTPFTRAVAYCSTAGTVLPLLIPSSNKFYRITDEINITERYFELFGEGRTKSVIYIDAAAKSAIVINGAADHSVYNLGIAGKSGSYDGIQITGSSDRGHIHDVWIGWTDRYCIHHINSNSQSYTNVNCNQNSGMRPAGLNDISGSLGSADIGLYIAGAANRNHNATLTNCHFNGVGSTYAVQVGDGAGTVQTFNMLGGLIQAAGSNKEIYLNGVNYGSIKGVHIESNALISTAYSIDIENCTNFSVESCIVSGAVRFQGTSDQSGINHCQTSGIKFESTVDPTCYAQNCSVNTGNGDGGPTGGHLHDFNGKIKLRDITGNRNYGDNLGELGKDWFFTDFTDWVGTTLPCGFNETGGGTASQEGTIKLGGTYSCKFVTTGASDFLYHVIHQEGNFSSQKIVVEAWVYNLTTAGLTTMTAYYNAGASTTTISTRQADAWERVLVTFDVPASTTTIAIRFNTSTAGTFYLGRFRVRVPGWYDHTHVRTLDDNATPDLKGDEGWVPEVVRSGGTTTITSFLNPIVGREFRFIADHALTINDTATINLSGGANQALTVGSSMSFVYDGTLFTETGRMIV